MFFTRDIATKRNTLNTAPPLVIRMYIISMMVKPPNMQMYTPRR